MKAELKLSQLVAEIQTRRIPDDHIVAIIGACHAGFPLDATALKRLADVGASDDVFESLNRDTLPRMQLSEAHAEVAALEAYKNANRGVQLRFFDRRITALEDGLLLASRTAPVFVSYDPQTQSLEASVDGEEFWFSIESKRAATVQQNWSSVRILAHYREDSSKSRFLADASNAEPAPGRLKSVILAERAKVHQTEAAIAQLRGELAQNPRKYPDTWYDASTGRLWTSRDNGRDVNHAGANHYCQTLNAGGLSHWRLPSIAELRSLFDRSQFSHVRSVERSRTGNMIGGVIRTRFYHIKGKIELKNLVFWSGTVAGSGRFWMTSFELGGQQAFSIDYFGGALCTHDLTPDDSIMALSQENSHE